ncbi:MAG: DNA polymerase III subunit gamma/tau [Pseudomonadales bacterium]
MSYQVLARKWRPKTFREMVGQEHVLKALINALDHSRLHHAYLFTGTRGVGKTTIARILAKCLNCEVGVSSEPCGQCSACTSINEGRFIDLIEVDAASRTKVEDTRELLENVQYTPTNGRYKVYLIDEVHMLSTHSFNALLKTLEEPPPHVKFLLATTDPQKLPATILSRCLQFNLKNMSPERIVGHLQYVLEQEMVSHEEPALWLLGRSADGSMRDALSLTDQAIAFGSGKLLEADVRIMLGTIDQSAVYDIIDALVQADGAQVLAAVARMAEHAPDFVSALEALLTLLHRIAIAQAVPDAIDNSFGDREKIIELAGKLAAEDVQLFYQLGLNGRRDLPLAPDPRSGFEMVLLRMLAFKPAGIPELPQGVIQNSVVSAAAVSPPPVMSTTAAGGAPQPVKKPESVSSALQPNMPPPQPVVETRSESESKIEPTTDLKPESEPAPVIEQPEPLIQDSPVSVEVEQPQAETHQSGSVTLADLSPASWNHLFERLDFGGVVGNIASHCVLERVDGDTVYLVLDENNATLFNDTYTGRIQEHLTIALNAPVTVKIEVRAITVASPSAMKERLVKERKQQALYSMQNDHNVQTLINDFDAVLDVESVEPL